MSRRHHFVSWFVSLVGLVLLVPAPARAQECVIDADCNDFNVCTKDLCLGGFCQHTNNAAACDDGLFCTLTDRCSGGVCAGSGTPCTPPQFCDETLNACVNCLSGADCSDGNPCTDDVCAAGFCSNPNNAAPCNDGNACTTGDACSGGACVGGPATNCNDGNVCTDDACNPATGCTHTNNTAPCNDGNACTTGDTCSGGVCVGGAAPNCDDGNDCTNDACNPATGCTHINNTAPCNDGNACTTGDACSGGVCVGGAAPNCDDGNVCTNDACNPATGCTQTNNTVPCNDGNACTTGDTCSGGVCVGGAAPNCDDGNVCTNDACNPATGCTHTNNTAPCDDGLFCTLTDVCSVGVCAGGGTPCIPPQLCDDTANACVDCLSDANCDDGDLCTDDLCTAGFCSNPDNTATCDDGLFCTLTDVCSSGVCTGSGTPCTLPQFCDELLSACVDCLSGADCNDGNPCTDEVCTAGVCSNPDNIIPCDDGLFCTLTDRCSGGVCTGGGTPCSPPQFCDETANACVNCLSGADCDNGNPCDGIETCVASDCVSGVPIVCDDGDPCNGIEFCINDGNCVAALFADCNGNSREDSCDIASGGSADCNANSIPDGCEVLAAGTMALIAGGEFEMGDPFNEGDADEFPRHAVHIDSLYMARYEVTNQQYADALNWAWRQGNLITVTSGVVYKYNSGTSYPYCDTTISTPYSAITWTGSTFGVVSGKADHPMVQVSWYGSAAYANWRSAMDGRQPSYDMSSWACNFEGDGYRLPTEAEWEKAARGGAIGRRFPWSDTDTIQHARANYFSSSGFYFDTSPTRGYHPAFSSGAKPYTSPAGYFAPNDYGLYDMAGNASEWCNDWYGSTYYASSPYNNPHGPPSGSSRVLRGGAWLHPANGVRCAYRVINTPGYRGYGGGLRLSVNGNASKDCNINGIPDACDIGACAPNDPSCHDCNGNGVPDACDIAGGASRDGNGNGIPDECEAPPPLVPDPSGLSKARFISFSAPAVVGETALRVRFVALHHVNPPYSGGGGVPFTMFEGESMFVGPPAQYPESASSGLPFRASRLQCHPHYQNWSTVGLLHVTAETIVPSSTYDVENLSALCAGNESSCAAVSAAIQIVTARWGDVEAPFNPPSPDPQPDTSDISAQVNKFKNALGAPIKARALLAGDSRGAIDIAPDMNFTHISACVDAFKGLPYPYRPGKCTGDSTKACMADADCPAQLATGPCVMCP